MMQVKIFRKNENVEGFDVKPGFIGFWSKKKLKGITFEFMGDSAYVYRKRSGKWSGKWFNSDSEYPVLLAQRELGYSLYKKLWRAVCTEAKRCKEPLYISDKEWWGNGSLYSPCSEVGVYNKKWLFEIGMSVQNYRVVTQREYESMDHTPQEV